MKLVKIKNRIDGKIWRCRKKGDDIHNNKLNIRNGRIFEYFKTDIRLLYFIVFYNFVENKSIKETYNNCKEFTKTFKLIKITKKQISKFNNAIRIKLKNKIKCIKFGVKSKWEWSLLLEEKAAVKLLNQKL